MRGNFQFLMRMSTPTGHMHQPMRWRLPFLISSLIAVILATFLWTAYREVERALLSAAGTRAQAAADHLALLLSQSTQQRVADLRRGGAEATVRACVEAAVDDRCRAARATLAPLGGTGPTVVELWNPRH